MELEKIITESSDFVKLNEEIAGEKLAKSILLISKDQYYSMEFARYLAIQIFNNGQFINNENAQKVKCDSHPDMKTFPAKERLMVADSENIVQESVIKPIFANKKVFIIKNIENGMEAAQNKLLKTLEEPASNVYFILTTSNVNLVLPTIRSRCNKVELGKVSDKIIMDLLGGNENSSLITALSDGCVGKAIELENKESLIQVFSACKDIVCRLKSSKEVLAYSKRLLAFKDDFKLMIEILSIIIEDLLMIKGRCKDSVRLKNYLADLLQVESEYTIKAIVEIRSVLDKAVKEMSYNCNFTVVFENLLLSILEVKYICR